MKTKIIFGFALIVMATLLNSCEGLLDNCKVCQLNQYEGEVLFTPGPESEYCDAELIAIQATRDVVDGIYTFKWECR